jgi:hypothetical protein
MLVVTGSNVVTQILQSLGRVEVRMNTGIGLVGIQQPSDAHACLDSRRALLERGPLISSALFQFPLKRSRNWSTVQSCEVDLFRDLWTSNR